MDPQQSQPCKGAAYPTKYRRNQPRSKNGCLTCRSKRKKCDETRPRCTSCVRSNQTCVWPSKDEQESPPSNSVGNTSDSTSSTSERKRSPNEDPQTAISDLNLAMESLVRYLCHVYFIDRADQLPVNYFRYTDLPEIFL